MIYNNFGCRYRGIPHEFKTLYENPQKKIEVCTICNIKKKYNKMHKGRINNIEYLKDHVRNFAQKFGATKRIYHKIYYPEKTIIKI